MIMWYGILLTRISHKANHVLFFFNFLKLNFVFCFNFNLVLPAVTPFESNFARKLLHWRAEKILSEVAYLFMPQNHEVLRNISPFGNDPYS